MAFLIWSFDIVFCFVEQDPLLSFVFSLIAYKQDYYS